MYRNYRYEENESKKADPSDNRVASVKQVCIRRVDGVKGLTQETDDVFERKSYATMQFVDSSCKSFGNRLGSGD